MYRPGIPGKANPLLCARRRTRLHASPLGSAAPRDYSKAFCAQRYLSSEGLGGSQSCPVLFAQRLPQQGDRAPVPKSAHLGMCVITRGPPAALPTALHDKPSLCERLSKGKTPKEQSGAAGKGCGRTAASTQTSAWGKSTAALTEVGRSAAPATLQPVERSPQPALDGPRAPHPAPRQAALGRPPNEAGLQPSERAARQPGKSRPAGRKPRQELLLLLWALAFCVPLRLQP